MSETSSTDIVAAIKPSGSIAINMSQDNSTEIVATMSFKRFPTELRLRMFKPNLDIQPGPSSPALLIALRPDEKLYAEAFEVFKTINFVVSVKNQAEFVKMPRQLLSKVENLIVVFESDDSTLFDGHVNLKNARAICINNFRSITVDFTRDKAVEKQTGGSADGTAQNQVLTNAAYMALGSKCGVDFVRVVYDKNDDSLDTKVSRLLDNGFNVYTGDGILDRTPSRVEEVGKTKVYTWEAESKLVKKLNFRAKPKPASFIVFDEYMAKMSRRGW